MKIAHLTAVDMTLRFLLLEQLLALAGQGHRVVGISAPGRWVADLERQGIEHLSWKAISRNYSPVKDIRAFAELTRILRRERFDVVHTHSPKVDVIGRLAARAAGIESVISTVHGLYATPEDPLAKRIAILALEAVMSHLADVELYQSEEDLAWVLRRRVARPSKARYLGNGVDLDFFDAKQVSANRLAELRSELQIPPRDVVVGTVGRMVPEKGLRELMVAARSIRDSFPRTSFLVVGEADLDKRSVVSATDLEAAGLRVTGWRTDVRDLLAVMDVFVLPSWREGVPRSAIEAAAMSRPLVLTDIRGCREVMPDQGRDFLFPRRDAAALAHSVIRLLERPSLRGELGEAARAQAQDKFDVKDVMRRFLDAYGHVLSGKELLPASSELRIRRAERADARVIATMHARYLPEAFLPRLGRAFMTQLYRALIGHRSSIVLVADSGSSVVGFVAGTLSIKRFYRSFVARRGIPAALVAIPHLVRPRNLRRLIETAKYGRTVSVGGDSELVSIAVNPAYRRMGLARDLVESLLGELAKRGTREVRVVVAAENVGGVELYRSAGFRPVTEISLHSGIPSRVFVHDGLLDRLSS